MSYMPYLKDSARRLHPEIVHEQYDYESQGALSIPEPINMCFMKHRVSGQICLESTELSIFLFYRTS